MRTPQLMQGYRCHSQPAASSPTPSSYSFAGGFCPRFGNRDAPTRCRPLVVRKASVRRLYLGQPFRWFYFPVFFPRPRFPF